MVILHRFLNSNFHFPAVVIIFYTWHFIRLYNKSYVDTAENCLINHESAPIKCRPRVQGKNADQLLRANLQEDSPGLFDSSKRSVESTHRRFLIYHESIYCI